MVSECRVDKESKKEESNMTREEKNHACLGGLYKCKCLQVLLCLHLQLNYSVSVYEMCFHVPILNLMPAAWFKQVLTRATDDCVGCRM